MLKLQLFVKWSNVNVIEIKGLVLLIFALFTKNKREEIRQNDMLKKMKLTPFPNSL